MDDSKVAILVMLNNLLHDFAVALLFASLLTLSFIDRALRRQRNAERIAIVKRLWTPFNRVILGCWVVIIFGGIIRTIAYEQFEWNEAAGRGQITALMVKHAVLVILILWGTAIQLHLRKRLQDDLR